MNKMSLKTWLDFFFFFFQGFIFNLLLGRHNLKGKIIESRRSGYGGDDSHGISHLGHGLEEPCRAPVVFLFGCARFLVLIFFTILFWMG